MDMPADIQSLYNLSPAAIVQKANGLGNKIRLDALRETAIGVGARAGLNARTKEILARLDASSSSLSKIYDFRGLLISNTSGDQKTNQYAILPPVISESSNSLHAISDKEIQIADKIYRIESQARFVTAPPTWQEYLNQEITKVEMPDASLLPKDSDERKMWKSWIDEGWKLGESQAESIFDANLNRLARDYQGMVRYKVLLKQNMVSLPFLAEQRLGVVGNESEMSIDSRALRITGLPVLKVDTKGWKPVAYKLGQEIKPQDAKAISDQKPIIEGQPE